MSIDFSRCPYCDSLLYCAADCDNAPWNHGKPTVSRFVYLLRMRRWCGSPVDGREIFFKRR